MKKVNKTKEELIELHNQLKSYKKVGDLFGVSGERIRQIIFDCYPKKVKWWSNTQIDWGKSAEEISALTGAKISTVINRKRKMRIKKKRIWEDSSIDFTKSVKEIAEATGYHESNIYYAKKKIKSLGAKEN